ncbi:MAG: hypothetical protein E3J37_00995 [Anaerolineales bacterium]|nr:MAG: hypothetical protein E3J37_00995 [Anaerolineales bacterium]
MTKISINPMEVSRIQKKPFKVGDRVEVYCDHNRDGERVRDWLRGVVVQADRKMVAVQFVEDIYLTNGWMIPDRVLWYLQNSDKIRPATRRRSRSRRK